MKLTLNNIGPIHQFEFDLDKDIHLIYGKNNVGKSYAVNFLYCFLKALDDIDIYQFRYKYRNLSLAKSHEDYIADIYTQIWKRLIEPKFEEYLKSTFSSILNLQNKRNRFESIIVFEDDKVILEVVLKDSQFTIDRISVKSSMN
ncbi:MAG: ATP-binding protein, partial [Bacteroidota bacterium]